MGPTNDQVDVRAAEVIGAACLATDLGMGFPFEHGLEATVVSSRLARLLDVDIDTEREIFYVSLLMYLGCNTDARPSHQLFGGSLTNNMTPRQFGGQLEILGGVAKALPDPDAGPLVSAYQVVTGLPKAQRFVASHFASMCEVAVILSDRFGAPAAVSRIFNVLTERWDGKGVLGRAAGEHVPLALRVVHVARDGAFQSLIGGVDRAAKVVRERGGGAFDPEIAGVFADHAGDLLAFDTLGGSLWDEFLGLEPKPHRLLDYTGYDRAIGAFGDFADLVSPTLSGHSPGVARLASEAATLAGANRETSDNIWRAGMVHDLGRATVHPRIWEKPGPLTADEWEHVRLHPYHTGRILRPSSRLEALIDVACCHHERMDGSGYHRSVPAAALTQEARLLAAADALYAMREERTYRPALSDKEAADELARDVQQGKLDREAVESVLEAVGVKAPEMTSSVDLTSREQEVIGLVARGLQTKQIARRLDISAKTVDRHIQNSYRKMGVSTRAGATLYATEHGLVPWGEFPIQ